jgi:hypothetical protein
MSFRLVKLSVVAALASGLVSCAAPPAPRVAAAQSASSGVHWGAVTTLENCPAFDGGGSGAYVRHFGDSTPWSENPFLSVRRP